MRLNTSNASLFALSSLFCLTTSLPFFHKKSVQAEPLLQRATYSVVPVDGGSTGAAGGNGSPTPATVISTLIETKTSAPTTVVETDKVTLPLVTNYDVSTKTIEGPDRTQTVLVTLTPSPSPVTVTTTGYSIINVNSPTITVEVPEPPQSSSSASTPASSQSHSSESSTIPRSSTSSSTILLPTAQTSASTVPSVSTTSKPATLSASAPQGSSATNSAIVSPTSSVATNSTISSPSSSLASSNPKPSSSVSVSAASITPSSTTDIVSSSRLLPTKPSSSAVEQTLKSSLSTSSSTFATSTISSTLSLTTSTFTSSCSSTSTTSSKSYDNGQWHTVYPPWSNSTATPTAAAKSTHSTPESSLPTLEVTATARVPENSFAGTDGAFEQRSSTAMPLVDENSDEQPQNSEEELKRNRKRRTLWRVIRSLFV